MPSGLGGGWGEGGSGKGGLFICRALGGSCGRVLSGAWALAQGRFVVPEGGVRGKEIQPKVGINAMNG